MRTICFSLCNFEVRPRSSPTVNCDIFFYDDIECALGQIPLIFGLSLQSVVLSVCLPRPSRGSQCRLPFCQQQHQSEGGLSGASVCQLCRGYQVQRSAAVPSHEVFFETFDVIKTNVCFKCFVYFVLKAGYRILVHQWKHSCHVSAVGWSTAPSFSTLLGEMVVEDTTLLQCNIPGLTSVGSAALFLLVVRFFTPSISCNREKKNIFTSGKNWKDGERYAVDIILSASVHAAVGYKEHVFFIIISIKDEKLEK